MIGRGFRLSSGRIGLRRGFLLSTTRLLLSIGRPLCLPGVLLRRWRSRRRLRLPARTIRSLCRAVGSGTVRLRLRCWRRCRRCRIALNQKKPADSHIRGHAKCVGGPQKYHRCPAVIAIPKADYCRHAAESLRTPCAEWEAEQSESAGDDRHRAGGRRRHADHRNRVVVAERVRARGRDCGGERAYDYRDRSLAVERLKDVVETRPGSDSRRVGNFPSLALGQQPRHRRQHRDARRRNHEHPSPRQSVRIEDRHQEHAESGSHRARQAAEALAACATCDRTAPRKASRRIRSRRRRRPRRARFETPRTKSGWWIPRCRCCKRESRPCTTGSCGGVRSDRSSARVRARRAPRARSTRTGARFRRRRDGSWFRSTAPRPRRLRPQSPGKRASRPARERSRARARRNRQLAALHSEADSASARDHPQIKISRTYAPAISSKTGVRDAVARNASAGEPAGTSKKR